MYGGAIYRRKGSAITAFTALLISCLCCLGVVFVMQLPVFLFLPFMLVWGAAVVADSPQFTTLVAQSVDATVRGTALTLVNSVGFAITVVSIQTLTMLQEHMQFKHLFFVLALGPVVGLVAMRKQLVKV